MTYIVAVATGVTDLNCNPIGQTFTGAFTTVAPVAGLVGWWPGDGNADDIVAENGGSLVGGTVFAAGQVGQAFSFDGVDDFVDVAPGYDVGAGDLTVELWYKANVSGATQV